MTFNSGDLISYSRYRGLFDSSRYRLSNEFLWRQLPDGSLLCTDTEADIDYQGNIILVLRDGKVYILGQIPNTEDNSNPRLSFKSNTLHIEYACYAKDGLRGKYYESRDYNLSLTPVQLKQLQYNYLCWEISLFLHPLNGHRRSKYTLRSDASNNCIYIKGEYRTVSRGYRPGNVHLAKQGIKFQNDVWSLLPPEEGNGFNDLVQFADNTLSQVLNYLNNTRFRLVDEDNTNYYILDTSDGVIDRISKTEYSKVIQAGINVVTDWKKFS